MKYGLYFTVLLLLGSDLMYSAAEDNDNAQALASSEGAFDTETPQPFSFSHEDVLGEKQPVVFEGSDLSDTASMLDEHKPVSLVETPVMDYQPVETHVTLPLQSTPEAKKSEFVEHLEDTYKVNLLKNKLEYLTSKLEVIQKNTLDLFEHIATKESIDVNNSTNTKKYYHKKIALLRQAAKAQKALFKSYLPELEAAFAQS